MWLPSNIQKLNINIMIGQLSTLDQISFVSKQIQAFSWKWILHKGIMRHKKSSIQRRTHLSFSTWLIKYKCHPGKVTIVKSSDVIEKAFLPMSISK